MGSSLERNSYPRRVGQSVARVIWRRLLLYLRTTFCDISEEAESAQLRWALETRTCTRSSDCIATGCCLPVWPCKLPHWEISLHLHLNIYISFYCASFRSLFHALVFSFDQVPCASLHSRWEATPTPSIDHLWNAHIFFIFLTYLSFSMSLKIFLQCYKQPFLIDSTCIYLVNTGKPSL